MQFKNSLSARGAIHNSGNISGGRLGSQYQYNGPVFATIPIIVMGRKEKTEGNGAIMKPLQYVVIVNCD